MRQRGRPPIDAEIDRYEMRKDCDAAPHLDPRDAKRHRTPRSSAGGAQVESAIVGDRNACRDPTGADLGAQALPVIEEA